MFSFRFFVLAILSILFYLFICELRCIFGTKLKILILADLQGQSHTRYEIREREQGGGAEGGGCVDCMVWC